MQLRSAVEVAHEGEKLAVRRKSRARCVRLTRKVLDPQSRNSRGRQRRGARTGVSGKPRGQKLRTKLRACFASAVSRANIISWVHHGIGATPRNCRSLHAHTLASPAFAPVPARRIRPLETGMVNTVG